MNSKTHRSLVKGFLKVDGRKTVNEDGQEIILSGVGFGNWLLPEGYMWNAGGIFDRPHRIAAVIRHLTGTAYSQTFWETFRETYITRRDIELVAEMGFNSVRIPINSTILLADEPGLNFLEEGFQLIDRCLDWCEEFNLYAILDLHGAPGGQTGSNIDDCFDDLPRLFIDQESRDRTIALWEEIARRYRDRWIVAAYDLLNEPLRTSIPNKPDVEYLHPELVRFYEDCIAAIRKIDTRHALSIEGANWATRTDTFYKPYDPQTIIHFHRYGNLPGEECYDEWLNLSKKNNAPIWLGESGENRLEWYGAMFPLAVKLGFGFNFWTWKRMGSNPAPLEIKVPKGWNKILEFVKGGPRPTYAEAQQIFDEYLFNIQTENCHRNDEAVHAILRRNEIKLMATDFDTGADSCSGSRPKGNLYNYRAKTGMKIKPRNNEVFVRGPGFQCGWEKLCLELTQGEWVVYSIHDVAQSLAVQLRGESSSPASLKVSLADGSGAHLVSVDGTFTAASSERLQAKGDVAVRIECTQGSVDLHAIQIKSE